MLVQLMKDKLQNERLSLRAAARQIGVSHTTIARVLNGEQVDMDTLVELANWLGVPPSTLLNTQGDVDETLSDKIASVLETEPRLKEVFEEAINRIERGEASPQLLSDIISYAKYKLDMESAKRGGEE